VRLEVVAIVFFNVANDFVVLLKRNRANRMILGNWRIARTNIDSK
jgi:hypothetical protein